MNQNEKIIVTIALYGCCMCPTIILGKTADGGTVFARYRWGHLSVRYDERDPAPHGGAAGVRILEKQLDPEGIDGCLDYDELKAISAEIIDWPSKISPGSFDDDDTWLEL